MNFKSMEFWKALSRNMALNTLLPVDIKKQSATNNMSGEKNV